MVTRTDNEFDKEETNVYNEEESNSSGTRHAHFVEVSRALERERVKRQRTGRVN